MGEKKIFTTIFVLFMMVLSGCSLFVAQAPVDDEKVCVSKEKLNEVLLELNITADDLDSVEMVEKEEMKETTEEPVKEIKEEETTEEPVEETKEEETTEEPVEETKEEETTEEPKVEESTVPVRNYIEGDLVKLSPTASDDDGDTVTFTYSEPLNEDGEWQTATGDAGEYLISVTASDGKASVTKEIKIVVTGGNAAPVISNVEDLTVTEGDSISLNPEVSDEEGDDITITYSGWMSQSSYTTDYNDAGEYVVVIKATDGTTETQKSITITVEDNNRAPVLANIDSVTAKEGESIAITAVANDPDGDEVTISYSSPLNANGEWETTVGDAGTYLVTITATDSNKEDKETISIVVEADNAAPVIELEDVEQDVTEGSTENIVLSPTVSDPDGDDVTISYSGWMTENSKVVSEDDEGDHEVTVTATDGELESSVTITVTVTVNTVPDFNW